MKARELLGQSEHSTEDWTAERAIAAWRDFEKIHGYTPTQIVGHKDKFPPEVIKRGQTIRGACARYKVLDEARLGKSARKIRWTLETLTAAWIDFEKKYQVPVNLCVGGSAGKYPKKQSNEAARIYGASRKHGLLETLKALNQS